ncbi:MAG: lysylphosphatidylglycerol synthase transmembrane domain-containing protein [Candidatus Hermodarchaeota archaeon]
MQKPRMQTLEQVINFRPFIFGIILAVFVYLVIMILSGWENLISNLLHVNPIVVIVAMFLSLTNYIFRFFKWHLFTRSLELEIPIKENFMIFIAGLSLAITPAKAGEAIRAFLLRKSSSTDLSKGLASTLSERLVDLIAVTILALIGVIILGSQKSIAYIPLLIIILLTILIGVVIFLFDPLYHLFSRILHLRSWNNLGTKIDKFRSDVLVTFQHKVFVGALGLGMIGWACEGLGFFLIAQNLGIIITFEAAIFIYATSSLLGALSFLPGGLGVTEGSMEIFLADIMKTSLSLAGALIILIRLTTLWFGVTLGLITLIMVTRKINKISQLDN